MTTTEEQEQPKIRGYRVLTDAEIAHVNKIKEVEAQVAELWKETQRTQAVDSRWLFIAKTKFEEGFMALNRSVTRPVSPFEE